MIISVLYGKIKDKMRVRVRENTERWQMLHEAWPIKQHLSREPKAVSVPHRFLKTLSDTGIISAKSLRQGYATNQMFQKIKEAPMADINKGGLRDSSREIGIW